VSGVEERLAALDNENKARKAIYPVAGSLVRFVAQTSQTWTVPSASPTTLYRIKFQAEKYGSTGKTMSYLMPQLNLSSSFSGQMVNLAYSNEPQAGDGSVVVRFHLPATVVGNTVYIRVIATGPSTGVFTSI